MNLSDGWRRLRSASYQTALYRATLRGHVPAGLICEPHDPWPGDPAVADAMFQGRFRFAGREARAPNQPPWRLRADDAAWMRGLHRFDWLRDFAASGGDMAREHARRLVRSWIDLCGDYEPLIWAPEVIGRRLLNWLGQAGFLLPGADPAFTQAFLESIAMQWRHLLRVRDSAEPGLPALEALLGATYGALVLPNEAGRVARLLAELERLLARQVHADGGYITRSPSDQLQVLRDLLALGDALTLAGEAMPGWLPGQQERLAGMLRALRHGDGGLALFNGGYEETAEAVQETLARLAGSAGKILHSGGDSGYQRLAAAQSLVLFDAGVPPAGAVGRHAHAGTGAFEFSVGRHRLVSNCGSGLGRSDDWQGAMWRTAAQSAASIGDRDSAERQLDGGFRRQPEKLRCRRHEDESGAVWLEFAHDGFRARTGFTLHRRLYLDGSGIDLRGEDSLHANGDGRGASPRNGDERSELVLRFHLHPEVQASPVQGGSAVLLKVGGSGGWRFRVGGGSVTVEESVYLGLRGVTRRAEQIVVRAPAVDGATVKWAFRQA